MCCFLHVLACSHSIFMTKTCTPLIVTSWVFCFSFFFCFSRLWCAYLPSLRSNPLSFHFYMCMCMIVLRLQHQYHAPSRQVAVRVTRLLRPHRRSDEEDSFWGVFTFPSSGTFTLNICVLSFPLVYAQYCLYHCTLFFHTLFPLSLTFFSLWHFSSLPLFSTVHGRTFRCIIRHNLSSSHMRREKKALPYLLSHSTFLLFFFCFVLCVHYYYS